MSLGGTEILFIFSQLCSSQVSVLIYPKGSAYCPIYISLNSSVPVKHTSHYLRVPKMHQCHIRENKSKHFPLE